ncbi:hypothetical protein [Rhizobium tubonense]|uniref:Uncharacterized protein n=1 Tax=Rhizobium tubonense TaxID=484088 RepID=A0A2W4DTF0_9HYPH|nr:hypothetical protein [Rhizobium tubonense]PZM07436.1 hypothetical protein CPY51_31755 [Rhizobium tubonense]
MMKPLVGRTIEEFRRCVFYMDGKLLDEHVLLFFKIEDSWYSISFSDGQMAFRRQQEEPQLSEPDDFDKDFAYPVFTVDLLSKYAGREIRSTSFYVAKIPTRDLFGIYVSYGDSGFCFLDEANGDYCYLQDGPPDTTDDSFELVNRDLCLEI